MKRIIVYLTVVVFLMCAIFLFQGSGQVQTDPITPEKLRLYPVPKDDRNYFFLQSIEDKTQIVIGSFTGTERLITLLTDRDGDRKAIKALDYYPNKREVRTPKQSKSPFYDEDFERLMRKIIEGTIFVDTYSYQMKSIGALKQKIEEGSDIRKEGDGYRIILYDPDLPSEIMSEFFFSKRLGKYNLIFRTRYYKIFNASIYPPLQYSVYCTNTSDKIIRDVVESLLQLVR